MLKHILLLTMLTVVNCTSKQVTFRTMGGYEIARGTLQDYDAIQAQIPRSGDPEAIKQGPVWRTLKEACTECRNPLIKYSFLPQINKDEGLDVMVVSSKKPQVGIYIFHKFYTVALGQEILDEWLKREQDGRIELSREDMPTGLVQIIERDMNIDRDMHQYVTAITMERNHNDSFSIDVNHYGPRVPDGSANKPKDVDFDVIKETGCLDICSSETNVELITLEPSKEQIRLCLKIFRTQDMPIWASKIVEIALGNGLDQHSIISKDILLPILSTIPDDLQYRTRINGRGLEIIFNNPDHTTCSIFIDRIYSYYYPYAFYSNNSEAEFMPDTNESRSSLKTLLMNLFVDSVPIESIMRVKPIN